MKKKLFKSLLIFSFLLITFFSIKINGYAANFAYADFNWEELLERNKNYWTSLCREDDEDCVDEVLVTKERFYKRLYYLLAKMQYKGYYINDNYIHVIDFHIHLYEYLHLQKNRELIQKKQFL